MIKFIDFAGSSNGRTTDSGSVYLGSSPSPAASWKDLVKIFNYQSKFEQQTKERLLLGLVYQWF